MKESLTLTADFPVTPHRLYTAWLDSVEHGAFTGSKAEIDPGEGGSFTAWDGYIQGKNLELEPDHRILQSWRTTDFHKKDPDSLLEILLETQGDGTRLTMLHTLIPEGQSAEYRQGWKDYYFESMMKYFSKG